MAYTISVNGSVFSISDGSNALVKNKEDILCRVSESNTSVVEIYETSPSENERKIIFSSLYTDFSSPTGTSASIVVDEVIALLNVDYNTTGTQPDIPLTLIAPSTDQTITAGYSAFVSGYYEIADTKYLEIGEGSVLEIG